MHRGLIEDGLALVVRWVLLAFAVWVAAWVVNGIDLGGWRSGLGVAAVLGLLNLYVRPTLTNWVFPWTLLTFGLLTVVINAGLLALASMVADRLEGIDFVVNGPEAAFLGALVISLVSLVLRGIVDPERVAERLMHAAPQKR